MRKKKIKEIPREVLVEIVKELPQTQQPLPPAYFTTFQKVVGSFKLGTLRSYLEEFQQEFSVTNWNSDCLDCFADKQLEECARKILVRCQPLGSLQEVTRFLFAKYAMQKARFSKRGVYSLQMPLCRMMDQLNDDVLMMSVVVKLTTALNKTPTLDGKHYKNNVYYTRRDGLSIFCIDRYDILDAEADAQVSIVYLVDVLAKFFVMPLSTPLEVILNGLRAALGFRLETDLVPGDLPLHSIIKSEAKKAGLRRDMFSDYLKDLLSFQANTLRLMVREPQLTKYPSQHECVANSLSLTMTDGLKVTISRKGKENFLETLYHMERNNQLVLPEEIIDELAANEKNSFSAFECEQLLKKPRK